MLNVVEIHVPTHVRVIRWLADTPPINFQTYGRRAYHRTKLDVKGVMDVPENLEFIRRPLLMRKVESPTRLFLIELS